MGTDRMVRSTSEYIETDRKHNYYLPEAANRSGRAPLPVSLAWASRDNTAPRAQIPAGCRPWLRCFWVAAVIEHCDGPANEPDPPVVRHEVTRYRQPTTGSLGEYMQRAASPKSAKLRSAGKINPSQGLHRIPLINVKRPPCADPFHPDDSERVRALSGPFDIPARRSGGRGLRSGRRNWPARVQRQTKGYPIALD